MREIRTIGVTGATGGIGREVMRQAQMYPELELIPIGRSSDRRLDFDSASIEDYTTALYGLDALIHLAALTSEVNDPKLHEQYNVVPVVTLAHLAAEHGMPFVYTGSTAMYTKTPKGVITDSTLPVSTGAYGSAKIASHELAQQLATPEAQHRGYRAIQVVPGVTLGPDATWTHALVRHMEDPIMRTFYRFLRESQVGWTDIEDLATLLIAIARNPYVATTNRYLATNGNASWGTILDVMCELEDAAPLGKALPKGLLELPGRSALTIARKKAPIAPETLSFVLHGDKRPFVAEAAQKEYGWQPKSLEQTLAIVKANYAPRK